MLPQLHTHTQTHMQKCKHILKHTLKHTLFSLMNRAFVSVHLFWCRKKRVSSTTHTNAHTHTQVSKCVMMRLCSRFPTPPPPAWIPEEHPTRQNKHTPSNPPPEQMSHSQPDRCPETTALVCHGGEGNMKEGVERQNSCHFQCPVTMETPAARRLEVGLEAEQEQR